MSLAEGVIELVEETARREHARRVRRVVIEIGRLAAVDPEALRFAFEAVCRGGTAEEAQLEIVEIPGVGWCSACERPVTIMERYDACPDCGGFQVQATGGTEMRVREIEIE